MLLVIVVDVKDIHYRVGAAHKVRVISVNVRVLDLDQVSHHLVAWTKLSSQEAIHCLDNLLLKVLETREFLHLDLHDDSPQLFVDKLHTLQGW